MSGRNNRTNLSEPHAVRLARFREMAKAQITALGAAIRERREVVGLSANRLARQFPVDPRTVARWEAGETGSALTNLDDIAEYLETTPEALMARAVEISREGAPPVEDDADVRETLREIRGAQSELLARVAQIERLLKDQRRQQRPDAQNHIAGASR